MHKNRKIFVTSSHLQIAKETSGSYYKATNYKLQIIQWDTFLAVNYTDHTVKNIGLIKLFGEKRKLHSILFTTLLLLRPTYGANSIF